MRGGPTEGENLPAPRTPGSSARRLERRARAGEGEATTAEREEEDRGAGPRCALTWALAARRERGLLAGASVLLALPLASAFFALGHLA